MLEPAALLSAARLLASSNGTSPPDQACLRRAVSTAYYAVFHMVSRAASERFMGHGQQRSVGYVLLYRGFDHTHMARICKDLRVATLEEKYQRDLQRKSVSQDLRGFAEAFHTLQALRHLADYQPTFMFEPSEVSSILDGAEVAMEAFDRVAADEKADVLALFLVGIRG